MKNEKRLDLIDRNELIEEINQQRRMAKTSFPKKSFVVGDVLACIYSPPTVDAVDVVRCKDCIHAEPIPTNCELSATHYMHCGLLRGKETLNILHKQQRYSLGYVFEENYYKDYSLIKCDGYCDAGANMNGGNEDG